MKIIGIVGSIRRGNTYSMVEAACQYLQTKSDCDVELIHLKDISLYHCDGCLTCDETGVCHIRDNMTDLATTIKEADGFIFGSPARWSLLSGELKTFFDRLNPLAVPELLKDKKAIIFVVGQSNDEEKESIELAAQSIKNFCDNAEIKVIDTVLSTNCLLEDDLIKKHANILEECKQSAKKLYNNI